MHRFYRGPSPPAPLPRKGAGEGGPGSEFIEEKPSPVFPALRERVRGARVRGIASRGPVLSEVEADAETRGAGRGDMEEALS